MRWPFRKVTAFDVPRKGSLRGFMMYERAISSGLDWRWGSPYLPNQSCKLLTATWDPFCCSCFSAFWSWCTSFCRASNSWETRRTVCKVLGTKSIRSSQYLSVHALFKQGILFFKLRGWTCSAVAGASFWQVPSLSPWKQVRYWSHSLQTHTLILYTNAVNITNV